MQDAGDAQKLLGDQVLCVLTLRVDEEGEEASFQRNLLQRLDLTNKLLGATYEKPQLDDPAWLAMFGDRWRHDVFAALQRYDERSRGA